jgi:hypothetical protein
MRVELDVLRRNISTPTGGTTWSKRLDRVRWLSAQSGNLRNRQSLTRSGAFRAGSLFWLRRLGRGDATWALLMEGRRTGRTRVAEHRRKTLSIKDFRGRILILDFWGLL